MIYLGLGSNLGDKRNNIEHALDQLTGKVGMICACSDFYETQPSGYESKESYLNIAIAVETTLKPTALLSVTQMIEKVMGRQNKTINGKYLDRIIDIDILLYNDRIVQTRTLLIPHPLLHQRAFVLQPLAEIAPHAMHPVLGKSVATLYADLLSI